MNQKPRTFTLFSKGLYVMMGHKAKRILKLHYLKGKGNRRIGVSGWFEKLMCVRDVYISINV